MTQPLKILDTILGEGSSRICIPLISETMDELLQEAEEIRLLHPDLVEWRADHLKCLSPDIIGAICEQLYEIFFPIPVIFTLRTNLEGGSFFYDSVFYENALLAAAESKSVQLIDVEALTGQSFKMNLIRELKKRSVFTIASYHNFAETQSKEALLEKWKLLDDSGADILKLAVMPETAEDVKRLMEVTKLYSQKTNKPLISMSMGETGRISRIHSEAFGSCVTFASGRAASAPGQISIQELRSYG